ncbi:unnamed protein product [Bursaphelenchus okinawaensis]|uniref:Uncharacterized protein n=1 Tax=Bursaphelenchus okinawaensis TaxID=465554 RepID=A0A811LSK0_9BILA|nr:unnamed protein product [Bursaphelenchus okinawaensis]CAG9128347.1 unnamed protein product [Bursaphelenchus okinawaensis]
MSNPPQNHLNHYHPPTSQPAPSLEKQCAEAIRTTQYSNMILPLNYDPRSYNNIPVRPISSQEDLNARRLRAREEKKEFYDKVNQSYEERVEAAIKENDVSMKKWFQKSVVDQQLRAMNEMFQQQYKKRVRRAHKPARDRSRQLSLQQPKNENNIVHGRRYSDSQGMAQPQTAEEKVQYYYLENATDQRSIAMINQYKKSQQAAEGRPATSNVFMSLNGLSSSSNNKNLNAPSIKLEPDEPMKSRFQEGTVQNIHSDYDSATELDKLFDFLT